MNKASIDLILYLAKQFLIVYNLNKYLCNIIKIC